MSGCGRKHLAKHLTQQFLDDSGWDGLQVEKYGEELCVVQEAPSAKVVAVSRVLELMSAEKDQTGQTPERTEQKERPSEAEGSTSGTGSPTAPTAPRWHSAAGGKNSLFTNTTAPLHHVVLPGKFHKVVWLARGDAVVVRDGQIERKITTKQMEFHLSQLRRQEKKNAEDAAKEEDRKPTFSEADQIQYVLDLHNEKNESSGGGAEAGSQEEEEDDIMVNGNRVEPRVAVIDDANRDRYNLKGTASNGLGGDDNDDDVDGEGEEGEEEYDEFSF